MRCDAAGANCAAIAGATAQTYALTATDVGATLVAVETATNAGGSGTAASALTGTVMSPAKRDPGAHDQLAAGAVRDRPAGADAARVPRDLELQPRLVRVPMGPLPGGGLHRHRGRQRRRPTRSPPPTSARRSRCSRPRSTAAAPATRRRLPRSAVVKATSAVSLVVSPAPLVAGQRATLIATISSGSGNARPSGSVVFLNGLRAIPGCGAQPVSAGGQTATVVCQASFPAGAARFVAAYQPAAGAAVTSSTSGAQSGRGRAGTRPRSRCRPPSGSSSASARP